MSEIVTELGNIEFKIGDKVIFECSGIQKNQPRYQFNDDLGPTDIWAEGTITSIDDEIIKVEFTIENYVGTGQCLWPNIGHVNYDPLQWWQEGYMQLLYKTVAPCECGADVTYGIGATHVSWCPKYEN